MIANLVRGLFHKVPHPVVVPYKFTCIGDIGVARGAGTTTCTVTEGENFFSSVNFAAEGILTITPKFTFKQVWCSQPMQTVLISWPTMTSYTGSTPVITWTFEKYSDGTTDLDPDGSVITGIMVFNLSSLSYV